MASDGANSQRPCSEVPGRDRSEEFTNEELRDAIHPDDRARAVAAIERAIEMGDDYDVEYRIIRPDGTTGWVMIRGRLIRDSDGRYIAMSGVSLDIGRSKETEAALIESEARFKTFAQVMPNQVWSATPDGLLDWFNEQVLSYSGLTFDDLMGTGWAQMVHPADIGAAASAWEKALTEAIPYQAEFRLRRWDEARSPQAAPRQPSDRRCRYSFRSSDVAMAHCPRAPD
jgi:PAS domain S-box-containing protein